MTRKIRVTVRSLAIGGVLAAGTFALPAPAAQAALLGCFADATSERTAVANCLSVTDGSHFRVKATCYRYTNGSSYTLYGPWRWSATPSSASCLTGFYVDNPVVDGVG